MNRDKLAQTFAEKCRDTIAEYQMLGEGDRVVVGISGGADSVALLHILHSLLPVLPQGITLAAAHLNHNLRGQESDRDEHFVRDLCRRLNIPLTVQWLPVGELAKERGQSIELCARELRYEFFRQLGGKTATAHTLDDSAETVLLNLVRGSGLRGMCGIPPVRANTGQGGLIIRPLVACTRREVEAYCAVQGLGYVTDSSNLADDYSRNRLRHQVMPVLRGLNPAFPSGLAEMTRSLRIDADYLDALATQALARIAADRRRVDAVQLADLAEPLRRRILLHLLSDCGIPADRHRIAQMESLLYTGGSAQLSGRWSCRCVDGFLELCSTASSPAPFFEPVALHAPYENTAISVFSNKLLTLTRCERTNFEESINILPNQFKNALDCDRIGKIVIIRRRMPGDAIRLAGRGCTKTLKKLFNEADLSQARREQILVLAGEDGLLWVESFGVAEAAKVVSTTKWLLNVATESV